jgi:hypothetical protein
MRVAAILLLTLLSAPAFAGNGTAVPEPSSMALFGLGVLGVIVGRRGARKRD